MKIARVVCVYQPYKSGMTTTAYNLTLEEHKLGYEIVVFTPDYGLSAWEKTSQKNVYWISPIFKYGNAAFVPQLFWLLRKFDYIFLQYPFFGGAEVIFLLKKFFNKKVKLILRYEMDVVGSGWLQKFFSFYARFFLPKIIASADKVLVSSFDYARNSAIKDYYQKFPNKFVETGLGVDVKRFQPRDKDNNLLKSLNISPDDFVLLMVGGLDRAHYFKGVENMLRALAEKELLAIKEKLKLLIIGQDGDLKEYYQNLILKLNLTNQVKLLSSVSDQDLPLYYNLSDLFVFPSIDRSEAFGLVLLEAQASGVPCVVSDLPGVRRTIIPEKTGLLVSPNNVSDLAQKIKYLFQNPLKRKEFGVSGRQNVLSKYTWEIVAKKEIQVALDVLSI